MKKIYKSQTRLEIEVGKNFINLIIPNEFFIFYLNMP